MNYKFLNFESNSPTQGFQTRIRSFTTLQIQNGMGFWYSFSFTESIFWIKLVHQTVLMRKDFLQPTNEKNIHLF